MRRIPTFGQYKPEREGFIYNKEEDSYLCQRGNKAVLLCRGARTDSKAQKKRIGAVRPYARTAATQNVVKAEDQVQKIDDSIDKPYYDRMHKRLQTPKAKRMARVRQYGGEPCGRHINFGGMRRIWTRERAGKQDNAPERRQRITLKK